MLSFLGLLVVAIIVVVGLFTIIAAISRFVINLKDPNP